MFANLSLSQFTWKREPILYLALALAAGKIVYDVMSGSLDLQAGVEAFVVLLFGFFGRGQVSPT